MAVFCAFLNSLVKVFPAMRKHSANSRCKNADLAIISHAYLPNRLTSRGPLRCMLLLSQLNAAAERQAFIEELVFGYLRSTAKRVSARCLTKPSCSYPLPVVHTVERRASQSQRAMLARSHPMISNCVGISDGNRSSRFPFSSQTVSMSLSFIGQRMVIEASLSKSRRYNLSDTLLG